MLTFIYNVIEQEGEREREREIAFKFPKCLEWYKNIIWACFGEMISDFLCCADL